MGMTRTIVFLFLTVCSFTVEASNCRRPHLSRRNVQIYSTQGHVPVKVNRCFYNNTLTSYYSDVSDSCLKAFQSGVFEDKWAAKYELNNTPSIIFEEYVSKADLIKNQIRLRSGTVCQFTKGFCYDPREGNDYAVVWEILDKPQNKCPEKPYQLFEGDVDFWEFKEHDLTYLFHYNQYKDEAFYLALTEKGHCQDRDVWHTEEGFLVSFGPLESADVGEVDENYFSNKPKKEVTEEILRNCELRSQSLDKLDEVIDTGYLSDPKNLNLFFKKHYDQVKGIQKHVTGLVNNESITIHHKINEQNREQAAAVGQLLEKINKEIEEIKRTVEACKSGKEDSQKLVAKIDSLFKKSQELEDITRQLIQANKKINNQLNLRNLDLEKLIERVELIQNVINVHIPDFISKSEVIDKLTDIELNFEQKIKELAANVTKAMVDHEAKEARKTSGVKGGVKGGSSGSAQRYELEQLIIEKLKSYNEDQCESAVNGLREKTELLVHQLRHETFVNVTVVDEKILKILNQISAEKQPLIDELKEVDQKILEIFKEIKIIKENEENLVDQSTKEIQGLRQRIDELSIKGSDLQKVIIDLVKGSENKQVCEKTDIGEIIEKLKIVVNEFLEPRDRRLDSLEIVTVHLTEQLKKDEYDIDELMKKIPNIFESLKKFDTIKDDLSYSLENNLVLVRNNITSLYELLDEQSKIQSSKSEKLNAEKITEKSEQEKLFILLKKFIDDLEKDVISNKERIENLESEDNKDDSSLDVLKKELLSQETALKELESLIKTQKDQCEKETRDNLDFINDLKQNTTELYNLVTKHDQLILLLQKEAKKEAMTDSTNSDESDEHHHGRGRGHAYGHGTKGKLVSQNGVKGGVKGHGHSREDFTEDNSETIERQNEEISTLKIKLSEATAKIDSQESKIAHLQRDVERLVERFTKSENAITRDIKNLDIRTVTNHVDLVGLESELKSKISKCCGASRYTGVKTAGVKTAGVKTAGVKTQRRESFN